MVNSGLSAFVSITLFLILIFYKILNPLIHKIYDWSYVRFDIAPLISSGIKSYSFLNINFVPMFYGISIMILAAAFLMLAHHHAGEKLRHNKTPILFYMLIYPVMIGVIWLGVVVDLIRGKIQKW